MIRGLALPAHDDHVHGGDTVGGTAGSALYDVMTDHIAALVVLVVAPVLALAVWRTRHRWPLGTLPARLAMVSPERCVAIAVLALSALVHAVIVPAHGWAPVSVAFAVDTAALGLGAWMLLVRRRGATAVASLALVGSLLGLAVSAAAGETPDQVAMATKIVEIVGLVALWAPLGMRRARTVVGVLAAAVLALVVAVPVWAVALGGGQHGDGHDHGSMSVGMLMDPETDQGPTPEQQAAADALYEQTVAAVAAYQDPAAAAAAGFGVDRIVGTDFHAGNPQFQSDGRMLDPERPENLVYGRGADGPVLLGVMYETESLGETGPQVGGPLTVWHRHEQVCFGLLPLGLAGLTSPYGLCPAGSVTVARTGEMIHVWTVPGAPARFGDLPDGWREAYLAGPGVSASDG